MIDKQRARSLAAAMAASHPAGGSAAPGIKPLMTLSPVAADASEYELIIYGDIGESWWGESVTAQSVVEQLNALGNDVTRINVRINSYGGSVADGLAIYNALKRHGAEKAVTVDGVAMSSASLIAMAGDTVNMPATSMLMIHAPWGGIAGNAKELRDYADVLDQFADAMANAYAGKSGMDRGDALALLTDGEDHYYTGAEAVEAGFADLAEDSLAEEGLDSAAAMGARLLDRFASGTGANDHASMAALAAMRPASHAVPGMGPAPDADAMDSTEHVTDQRAGTPSDNHGDTTMETPDPKAVLAADKQRRHSIRAQFEPFMQRSDLDVKALGELRQTCEDDAECTIEAAGQKLLAELGKSTQPLAPTDVTITRDERDNYREGAVAYLHHRANPGAHKMDDQAKPFMGMSLLDMARDALETAGQRTRGMSRREIAVKAMVTTSDLPSVLENVVTKTLRQAYEEAGRTFTQFCRQATLPDFKEVSRTQLSGAPDLKRVVEGAEYEFGEVSDGSEKYRVQKYGRIVPISWEAIVNDDLNALSRMPVAFGASAAALESDIVYAILTGNPNMSDGKALFHADHDNLGTATALADALDPAKANPLAEMRKMMTLQKGLDGRYISVRPRYLIVPPSLEETALKVTSANFVASKGQDLNVFGPSLIPISEPRLEDASSTAWFGAAEPTTVDTIEFGFLEGSEGVFTETRQGFHVDGIEIKCRHVFGAKAIDYRGLFKNAGA